MSLMAPARAFAQSGGPGFLFKRPLFSASLRFGYSVPRMHGDLFDFTLDEFMPAGADTLSSLSFDSPYLGAEISFRPWERWDIAVGVAWTSARQSSEYRRWIDNSGNPIEQQEKFQVVSGTVGVKYYLGDRGRSVGSLTWVPGRLAPYLSTGIGVSSYEFVQQGDFIDSGTLLVSSDYLRTTGGGFLWYGAGGVDVTLAKVIILTGEVRYALSGADVAGSYVDFDNIDLAGLHLLVGLGFQF